MSMEQTKISDIHYKLIFFSSGTTNIPHPQCPKASSQPVGSQQEQNQFLNPYYHLLPTHYGNSRYICFKKHVCFHSQAQCFRGDSWYRKEALIYTCIYIYSNVSLYMNIYIDIYRDVHIFIQQMCSCLCIKRKTPRKPMRCHFSSSILCLNALAGTMCLSLVSSRQSRPSLAMISKVGKVYFYS